MSQKKVDDYKKYKANKKKIWKREKRIKRLEITIFVAVLVGLIAWFSHAVYRQVSSDKAQEVNAIELDTSAIDNYQQDLSAAASSASSSSSDSSADSSASDASGTESVDASSSSVSSSSAGN